jgi:Ca2+-binding EF-hand superfamily protein
MLIRMLVVLMWIPFAAIAEEPVPSVEDNIRAMDTDHDGIVTAHEMRVFLEKKHGKDYQQEVMDELEKKAEAKSCASPFTKSFY